MSEYFDEEGKPNLFGSGFASCPQPGYEELRTRCPVARTSVLDQVVIARHEDVVRALRQPEIFSSRVDLKLALGTERPMIPQQIDPPEQTRYRRLLDPHFSRRKMQRLEPQIREQAGRLIDGFFSEGRCEFDQDFAVPLPCNAFLHLFGLPGERMDFFLEIKDDIIRPHVRHAGAELPRMKEIRAEAGQRMYAYFEEAMDERMDAPSDDLLGALLSAEIDGEKLERSEILDICFLMLLAGLDTVTATLGCNLAYLAANPEQRRRIVESPALIPGAVEELLRWETPVTVVPRVLLQDVEIGGQQLEAGQMVTLLLGSANTDPEHFEDADVVDFERARNVHAAFGVGPHRCLGSHLARMELVVAMEEWHARIPDYRLQPGETPRYSSGIRELLYLPLEWDVPRAS